MEGSAKLSPRQLFLQKCLSQRRIDKINRVLSSGVQSPIDNAIDAETAEVVSRLYDTSLSDADISSCIGILQMLLVLDGLKPLLNLMKSTTYSMSLRQQAAKSISVIGSSHVARELKELLSSPSAELRVLAEVALGTGPAAS
jgi:hypothetical protein